MMYFRIFNSIAKKYDEKPSEGEEKLLVISGLAYLLATLPNSLLLVSTKVRINHTLLNIPLHIDNTSFRY